MPHISRSKRVLSRSSLEGARFERASGLVGRQHQPSTSCCHRSCAVSLLPATLTILLASPLAHIVIPVKSGYQCCAVKVSKLQTCFDSKDREGKSIENADCKSSPDCGSHCANSLCQKNSKKLWTCLPQCQEMHGESISTVLARHGLQYFGLKRHLVIQFL